MGELVASFSEDSDHDSPETLAIRADNLRRYSQDASPEEARIIRQQYTELYEQALAQDPTVVQRLGLEI